MTEQNDSATEQLVAQPRCPGCDVSGSEHIVSTPSRERSRAKQPWFYIVHCANCGHVYNTLSKHSFSQAVTPNFVLPKPS
jgi:uncharacterized Zn finger protein